MNQDEEYETLWKDNRERKHEPQLGKFYCGCDFDIVRKGGKCEVCGYKHKTKKFKK